MKIIIVLAMKNTRSDIIVNIIDLSMKLSIIINKFDNTLYN